MHYSNALASGTSTLQRSYQTAAGTNRLQSYAQTLQRPGSAAQNSNVTFSYDAAGALVKKGDNHLHYGADGRIAKAGEYADAADAQAVSYVYNALGQRVLKSDARGAGQPITVQTLYAEDGIGSTVLGQYANQRSANSAAPAGQSDSTEVIYLPTASGPMPIAAEINGRLYAIHTDHLNTPRRLTNQQGQVAWQWLISGFGEVRPTTGDRGYGQTVSGPSYAQAVKFDLRYPGQVFDEETGLSYNLHRYHDAATGRYIQADPIGLAGGWNRFGYVGGDPLGASDPMGLMPQCRWLGLVMHCSNVNHPIPGYENPSNPPWSWGNGGITENMGVPRPSDMTRLEERQWDRHCNGNPDPCGSLKNAVRIAIGMAMTKKKNMELDPSGLFGTIGWGTHATDLAGRIGNINAMIGLGEKLSCDMSQEKILAQTIYIPNRPFK